MPSAPAAERALPTRIIRSAPEARREAAGEVRAEDEEDDPGHLHDHEIGRACRRASQTITAGAPNTKTSRPPSVKAWLSA